ncbi:MAG TPA: acyl-CoA dehydrogenase family protein [Micropepsaceae bacterium]|nr:acyl-CoA dehydrogenase family protein [Micropepsaceae bacterium]
MANQPPRFENINLFAGDRVLTEAIQREGPAIETARLDEFGAAMGAAGMWEMAATIHRHTPELRSHDRYGRRIDCVEYHPAYHAVMSEALRCGTSAAPWRGERCGHTLHAALEYILAKVEPSTCCPVTMTYAAPAALKHAPETAAEWIPAIAAAEYDPSMRQAGMKRGVTVGMAMTEKQGGSDLRANTTRAEPLDSGWYRLDGHKWFCSAPMSDAFLTLAQTSNGLTCFLAPRMRRDGKHNGIHLIRLKDKLGDRANASSEIEYHGAEAVLIGEEGRGIRTLIDMVHHTRLDCAVAPAAFMQTALAQAVWHTSHRSAFGKLLIDQPLMRRVMADLAVEAEAATMLAFRLSRSFDEMQHDESQQLFSRLATPIAKFWLNKRVVGHVAECMECHGGGGYVEEWPIARFYRQAPLNGIWEGSGNVICLDVLRAMARHSGAMDVLLSELKLAAGANRHFDKAISGLTSLFNNAGEENARRISERIAVLLEASLMLRYAPPADADLFCASRLGDDLHFTYGAFADSTDVDAIIARAMPLA